MAPRTATFHWSANALAGALLLVCAGVALAWANSPWASSYEALRQWQLTIGGTGFGLTLPLLAWVNDALMALFFFTVGLEIKRELLVGELSLPRQAALPIAAAFGGMLVPAAIYAALNVGHPGAPGWGIPMATDIAFTLGVVALLGSRVPPALIVFLTALAIADDLGAVIVIAAFYTGTLVWSALGIAFLLVLLLVLANAMGVRHPAVYVLLGLALWVATLRSGVHATMAGVVLAMTIPARTRIDAPETMREQRRAPLLALEYALHGVVLFGVLPLFALANAGIPLGGTLGALDGRVALGTALGLLLGKVTGVTLVTWLSVRSGVAVLPNGVRWPDMIGIAWLAGIGFTMSLFITSLAFTPPPLVDSAKLGIFAGSTVAAVIGSAMFVWRGRTAAARRP